VRVYCTLRKKDKSQVQVKYREPKKEVHVKVKFSLPVQTGRGAYLASYAKSTGFLSWARMCSYSPTPSSAEVKETVEL
jgi:hypothetical protein